MNSNDYQMQDEQQDVIVIRRDTLARAARLLAVCDQFLRETDPAVRFLLRDRLDRLDPPIDLGWFIDMLGLNELSLRGLLEPGPHPSDATPDRALTGSVIV